MGPRAKAVYERSETRCVDPAADSGAKSTMCPPESPGNEFGGDGDVRCELHGHERAVGATPDGNLVQGGLIKCHDHVGSERSNRLLGRKAWLSKVESLGNVEHRESTFDVAAHKVVDERARPVQGLNVRVAGQKDDDRP